MPSYRPNAFIDEASLGRQNNAPGGTINRAHSLHRYGRYVRPVLVVELLKLNSSPDARSFGVMARRGIVHGASLPVLGRVCR